MDTVSPWVRKIPWRRAWLSTPVFLPGESHGQRSLVGYNPQGRKQSDTTEVVQHAHVHAHTHARTHTSYKYLVYSICSTQISVGITCSSYLQYLVKGNLHINIINIQSVHATSLQSCLSLCTLWTVAHQVSLSMGLPLARILEWVAISFSKISSR